MERTISYKRPGAGRTVTFDSVKGAGLKGLIYGYFGQFSAEGYEAAKVLIPTMPVWEELPSPKEFTGTIWLPYPENIPTITGLCRVKFIVMGQQATGIIPYNVEGWNLFGVTEFCEELVDNRQGIRNPAYWEAVERNEAKTEVWKDMFFENFYLCESYKIPPIPTTADNDLLPPEKRWRWYETINDVRTEIIFTPDDLVFPPVEVDNFEHPAYANTIKATVNQEPDRRLRMIFKIT